MHFSSRLHALALLFFFAQLGAHDFVFAAQLSSDAAGCAKHLTHPASSPRNLQHDYRQKFRDEIKRFLDREYQNRKNVMQAFQNLALRLKDLKQQPDEAAFEEVLAILQANRSTIMGHHDDMFWAFQRLLGHKAQELKSLKINDAWKATWNSMLQDAATFSEEVVRTSYAPQAMAAEAKIQAEFKNAISMSSLAKTWSKIQTSYYDLGLWLRQRAAENLPDLVMLNNQFIFTQDKNLAKTFVLNEAWLAARLPRIFNLYLQEMAVRLKQAGFPVQYYLPDNASEETTASLLIPVTLSYVPGADGPTSVASGPTYRFNFDLAKIKGREFAPLREFFQQVFTYAPDLAQIIDSLAWLKKINYFNLMIQDMNGCIMKNAQTHEFKYRARSKGVGGNIPGSYYYVNVDPSELWINPYLAGGTLAHEFHHAMKANSNEDFFFRLDDEGVIFNDLVGSGYDDHFSSDEIPARIDELKYYRQLAEKFQKEQNLPPEFNSHVPANFKQQKDLALKMLQDARILLQEALAELERNPESLELGQVGHPYMILNFHSSLISDTTKKVHLKLAKTAAFGLNGTTIDVQRLTYQYLPDTEFPGVDKESDTYFDLIDEVYRQFAQNPPAPYFEQFVQGMKIALAHGLELLEQYEAELRPIQLPKINNDHAWVKKFLGQN